MRASPSDFYDTIPVLDRFETVGDTERYRPLPAGWLIGVADVEDSTGAIAGGRYKAVNMVGASVISGMMNALKGQRFPFAFGGDGASIAIPADARAVAEETLARVRRYAREGLGLELRVGLVPIETIRAAGVDVRVARLRVSPDVTFGLFAGGGVQWAEEALKAGRMSLPEAPEGAWPDLEGLSCRWEPIEARNGRVLSLIAVAAPGASDAAFADLVTRISAIADRAPDRGVPVSAKSLVPKILSRGLVLESHNRRGRLGAALHMAKLFAISCLAWVLFRTGWRMGDFDPERYKEAIVVNSDFRKFDDGLRMTLDCDAATEAEIRRVLEEAHAGGVADYGIHTQDAALMTCIVPSLMREDHMHFIDGASGGYAQAAAMLKEQLAAAA